MFKQIVFFLVASYLFIQRAKFCQQIGINGRIIINLKCNLYSHLISNNDDPSGNIKIQHYPK